MYELGEGSEYLALMVEKMLDQKKWTKWNSNAGRVLGPDNVALGQEQPADLHPDALTDHGSEEATDGLPFALPVIREESDSEGEEGEDDKHGHAGAIGAVKQYTVIVSDFPQAFSHFTYRCSSRQRLVCDLQGTLDMSISPAVFELTDPAIHHVSGSGRSRVYGRTDHGRKGIKRFFETHQCNALCNLLGLPSD